MPVKNVKRRTNDGFEGTIVSLTDEEKNILNSAISTGALIANTVEEMNALVTNGQVKSGQLCYCLADKKLYLLKDNVWNDVSGSSDYIVKASILFTLDEINNLILEIQKYPKNEEINVFNKSTDVKLENFNGNIKRIIVDLSDITSSNTDYMIFNCGVNSTFFGQITASFSWFTGTNTEPCMNIFTLSIRPTTQGYYLYRYCIWHSGYSALKSSNN